MVSFFYVVWQGRQDPQGWAQVRVAVYKGGISVGNLKVILMENVDGATTRGYRVFEGGLLYREFLSCIILLLLGVYIRVVQI